MPSYMRGRADYFEEGDFNAACSMCGRKRKGGNLVRNWQGMWRCPEHNEARQPQDFVRGVQDIQAPPWVQPQLDNDLQICTYNGISAIPGIGLPGCMLPGRAIWDQSFYPPIPAPPQVITTDQGQIITTDDGQPIVT